LVDGARLTVVVVSYNVERLLGACLEALRAAIARAPDLPTRVVVVDNASRDGSVALVRERFPEFEVRALDRNLGFSAGNNVALRDADGPFVLLLNPDTEVRDDAPAALVRFLEAHPKAGTVGGRLVYPDGSFQHSVFRFPTLPMAFLDFFPINHRLTDSRLNGRYPSGWYDRPFEVDHPLGACVCIRREVLDQVGLMDEGYFMYAEEVDLCWRIKRAGWQVWYTPDATIVHHQGASTSQFRGEMLVQLHRSRYRFFERSYGRGFARLARLIVALGVIREWLRAAWQRTRGRMSAGDWRARREVYARLISL
jgi:N-acetylglucosaminyl-diphospho-decaprenol L-rhamnosyltransferase